MFTKDFLIDAIAIAIVYLLFAAFAILLHVFTGIPGIIGSSVVIGGGVAMVIYNYKGENW